MKLIEINLTHGGETKKLMVQESPTVADILASVGVEDVTARVNGEDAEDDMKLEEGDTLEIVPRSGKGRA